MAIDEDRAKMDRLRQLSDADCAAIREIEERGAMPWEYYLAGIRAGLERAAKVCDAERKEWITIASNQRYAESARRCAAAIRALGDGEGT